MRCLHACLALLTTAFMASCGPSDDGVNDPFQAHHLASVKAAQQGDAGFVPPPELSRTLGIEAQDTRDELVLLQAHGSRSTSTLQRQGLSILASREKNLRITAVDAAGDATVQAQQLREATARKPLAILLDPVRPGDFSHVIAESMSQGVKVIGLDASLSGCTSVIKSSPEAIGIAAAQTAVAALKRKAAAENLAEPRGRVVMLRGDEGPWCSEIATAFTKELQKLSGGVLVHDAPAEWSHEKAWARTQEAIRLQKTFDVVFAHSDAIARGASMHLQGSQMREDTLIIGTGGMPGPNEGMQLLHAGEIDATIAVPPLIDLALQLAVKLRDDAAFKPKALYEIAPMAVTPKNHADVVARGAFTLPSL
jgi:ribose transport system substrate-binding protein